MRASCHKTHCRHRSYRRQTVGARPSRAPLSTLIQDEHRQTCAHGLGDRGYDVHGRAGFTLYEMLAAVIVMAIMAAIVLPSMSGGAIMNLEAVAQVLVSDLALAQSAAIQYNTEWSVQFNTAQNTYTLVQTGTGTAPALQNPLASSTSTSYVVSLDQVGAAGSNHSGVKLAAVYTGSSTQPVTDIRFQALGGTGPVRSQDTVIWLSQGAGSQTRFVRLTVSWITGQTWVDYPTVFGPS